MVNFCTFLEVQEWIDDNELIFNQKVSKIKIYNSAVLGELGRLS